jgi:FixJ family two-component response regulator
MCAQALKAGAVDFLQKPCNEQDLLEAVATALDLDRRTQNDWRKRVELQQRLATLTSRERDVMALVVTGMLNKQIAAPQKTRFTGEIRKVTVEVKEVK